MNDLPCVCVLYGSAINKPGHRGRRRERAWGLTAEGNVALPPQEMPIKNGPELGAQDSTAALSQVEK